MSYYYQDMEYSYHGNKNHEYELYSDDIEPDHYYEPPEPDYHDDNANHENGRMYTEWETEPKGPEYRDDESHERKPNWDASEKEMEHGGYL